MFDNAIQRIKTFFSNNAISAAVDNVLAMFPSTILMPLMINSAVGFELFNISLVLLLSGVGTLLFTVITGGRFPGYLGSSFAFIGVSSYIAAILQADGTSQDDIAAYIMGGYVCAGIFLFLLSLLCRIGDKYSEKKTMEIINTFVPPAVMGPAISLIGLELSDQAINQAGLNGTSSTAWLAIVTIALIIILSVTHRSFLKKSSILLGLLIAGVIAVVADVWDLTPVLNAPVVQVPSLRMILPKFSLSTAFMVLPPTLILFCEHLGRKVAVDGMLNGFFENKVVTVAQQPKPISLFRSVSANACAIAVSGFFGGVPLTVYAENFAVMRINADARPNQFYIASFFVVLLSFSGNLLQLIQSIPDPILGGLSLVLMGIIAAPGIKMLVDENVDYSKITNLFLTASVLIVGLSNMSVEFFGTEFKGMSLGLLVGICFNIVFMLLNKLNFSKEHMSFNDLMDFCKTLNKNDETRRITFELFDNDTEVRFSVNGNDFIQISNDFDDLRITIRIEDADDDCLKLYKRKQIKGWIALEVNGYINDKKLKQLIKASYVKAYTEKAAMAPTPANTDDDSTSVHSTDAV